GDGVDAGRLRAIQGVQRGRVALVLASLELIWDIRFERLVRREEQIRVRDDDVEPRLERPAVEGRYGDLVGLVRLGVPPARAGVEVIRDGAPEMPAARVDGADHAVAEVRRLPQTVRIREGDTAKAARRRHAGDDTLPFRLDDVVRRLVRAPPTVD